VAGYSSTSLIL